MTDEQIAELEKCVASIRSTANRFQGQRLPNAAVGAIEGWCNRLMRIAREPAPNLRRNVNRFSILFAKTRRIFAKTFDRKAENPL